MPSHIGHEKLSPVRRRSGRRGRGRSAGAPADGNQTDKVASTVRCRRDRERERTDPLGRSVARSAIITGGSAMAVSEEATASSR